MDANGTRDNQVRGTCPLQSYEVALEIYIILNEAPHLSFTTRQLQKLLKELYGDTVRAKRIRQVCKQLSDRGRISLQERQQAPNFHSVFTYQATEKRTTVLMGSSIWEVAETINKMDL